MTLAVPVRQTHASGWLFAALALAALLVAVNWVGYDGADDRSYALAAEAWLRHFPFVADDHWAARHTVVLPVALSLAVIGQKELALVVPSLLFFAGFLWVNFHFSRRFLGNRTASILVMLLATTPEFIVQATYINNDIVEAFFASLSFWLFVAGTENGRARTLVGAGAASGLAFLTRETSAVLPIFFGVCLILDSRPARWKYVYLVLGFAAVVGAEMAYFGAMTGDVLYRYRLDENHDTVNRAQEFLVKARTGNPLDRQGNLSVGLWVDPFLMLFASQKYGLLFYLAIPAAVWAFLSRPLPRAENLVLHRAGRLALLWIAFVSLAFPILYLVPRYYVVPAWAGVLLIACAFHRFLHTRHARGALIAVAALVAVNGLSLYLENTNPRFAERAMISWLAGHPGTTVEVDPDMARRADILLHFAGMENRVVSEAPRPGRLFVYSPRNQELCKSQGLCKHGLYEPKARWAKVATIGGRPRAIGQVLRALHVARFVPGQIMQKIESPAPGIVVYRVR